MTMFEYVGLLVGIPTLSIFSCLFAMGHMHTWLKERAQVFGDNEGLRDELADIRGHVIDMQEKINAVVATKH